MKFASLQAALGSALLLSFAPPSLASHGHQLAHHHYGRRHGHGSVHAHLEKPRDVDDKLVRRGTCALPNDPTVVSVPGAMNGGWAMAPDRSCTPNSYCPYACISGMVMNQWKPNTTYTFPESMVSTRLALEGLGVGLVT